MGRRLREKGLRAYDKRSRGWCLCLCLCLCVEMVVDMSTGFLGFVRWFLVNAGQRGEGFVWGR